VHIARAGCDTAGFLGKEGACYITAQRSAMVDDQGRDKIPLLEEIAYLRVTFVNLGH
jgi:hypothetical protein